MSPTATQSARSALTTAGPPARKYRSGTLNTNDRNAVRTIHPAYRGLAGGGSGYPVRPGVLSFELTRVRLLLIGDGRLPMASGAQVLEVF
ncbi:hypothetical protein GCM10009735_85180 [Actinomadura chokoriensis]